MRRTTITRRRATIRYAHRGPPRRFRVQDRHKSIDVLQAYVRDADLFRDLRTLGCCRPTAQVKPKLPRMNSEFIVPLLALFLALFALGVVAALINLRDFIARRFRGPIYVGVVVLLMATSALVSRSGWAGVLAGVWVAFLAFVVSAHQLEHWRKETEERKQDARRKIIVGAAALAYAEVDPGFRAALRVVLRAAVARDIDKAAIPDLLAFVFPVDY
jgi:hypothetical protein